MRIREGKSDLLAMDHGSINSAFFTEVRITLTELDSAKSNVDHIVDAISAILSAEEGSDSYVDSQRMLTRSIVIITF